MPVARQNDPELEAAAEAMGYGAVKYADLKVSLPHFF